MFCTYCCEETRDVVETRCCKNQQHRQCLTEWVLKGHRTCPLCRGDTGFKIKVFLSKVRGRTGPIFGVVEAELMHRFTTVSRVRHDGRLVIVDNNEIHETREQAEAKTRENRRLYYSKLHTLNRKFGSRLTRAMLDRN